MAQSGIEQQYTQNLFYIGELATHANYGVNVSKLSAFVRPVQRFLARFSPEAKIMAGTFAAGVVTGFAAGIASHNSDTHGVEISAPGMIIEMAVANSCLRKAGAQGSRKLRAETIGLFAIAGNLTGLGLGMLTGPVPFREKAPVAMWPLIAGEVGVVIGQISYNKWVRGNGPAPG